MLNSVILSIALATTQPGVNCEDYNAECVARRIGELTAIYPAYAACAATPLARENFNNVRYNIEMFFGEAAAERLAVVHSEMKDRMAEYPPSIRRETAVEMNCIELEQTTASELATLFEDLQFFASQAESQGQR